MQINIVVLARLITDYVKLMPECKSTFERNSEAVLYTNLYYEVGNKIGYDMQEHD